MYIGIWWTGSMLAVLVWIQNTEIYSSEIPKSMASTQVFYEPNYII